MNLHETEDNARTSIVILIEWGGKKPSSTWYNRLHDYGLYSRMPKEVKATGEFDLLEWRATQNGVFKREDKRGMILQEGAIIVNSQALANDICQLAKREGAVFIEKGHMVTKEFVMSEKDFAHFEKFQQAVSKRGPRSAKEAGTYTVTCFSEVKTYEVNTDAEPFMCPHCSVSQIRTRKGKLHKYQTQFEGDATDYWKRTRFATGEFEVPEMITNQPGKPVAKSPKLTVPDVNEPKLHNLPAALKKQMELEPVMLWHVLDIAQCVALFDKPTRTDGRLGVIDSYILSGGQSQLFFNEPDGAVDLIDLCILDSSLAVYL